MTSLRRALLAAVLITLCAVAALAQGSYPTASPVAVNRFGQPVKVTVAICNTNPGTTATGCPANLVSTFTDITLSTQCSGSPGTQFLNNQASPSQGSGCSNPGTTDSSGNVLAFAAATSAWCQYYGPTITTYVMPCQFGSTGGGGGGGTGLTGTFTPGCIPVAAPAGSAVNLVCSSIIENGALVRTPEPFQAPIVSGTTPNSGMDFFGGDCSQLTIQGGHSFLCSDSKYNYGLHYFPNGTDSNGVLLPNPVGATYHIDGFWQTSICGLVQSLPAHIVATVYVDVLTTNEPCDPFNQGITLHLILGAQSAPYTFNVPMRIGPNEWLKGSGRGLSGTTTKGTTISPSLTYASPYISTTPSGFTISATASGCGGVFPAAGIYMVEVSWGPDTTRETQPAQETAVTVNGTTQCFSVVPPVSPPAGVTTYDVYGCQVAGCVSGQELWQAQAAIGSSVTYSTFQTGNGRPVAINNTGTFIVVGNANGPQGNAVSTQATFGARAEFFSIDCTNDKHCVPIANLTGEEGSIIDNIDVQNAGGTAWAIIEGYGNIGEAADNANFSNFTGNAGNAACIALHGAGNCDPSVAGIYIDQMTSMRVIQGATLTPTTGTTPVCVMVNGTQVAPIGGVSIKGYHMEKCPTGVQAQNGAQVTGEDWSCSPANITQCAYVFDTLSNIDLRLIRGGNTDAPVKDCSFTPCFVSTQGTIIGFDDFQVQYLALTVGSVTTCSVTGMGASGTCAVATGSNNTTGKMLLTAAGGGETPALSVTLTFASPGYGQNGASCSFEPVSAVTPWLDNTSHRITAAGTGMVITRWLNGGGTGTAFVDTNGVAIQYICQPY